MPLTDHRHMLKSALRVSITGLNTHYLHYNDGFKGFNNNYRRFPMLLMTYDARVFYIGLLCIILWVIDRNTLEIIQTLSIEIYWKSFRIYRSKYFGKHPGSRIKRIS